MNELFEDETGTLQLRFYGYLGLRGKAPGGPEEQAEQALLSSDRVDNMILPLILRTVYDDKNRQEAMIRDSGLDWILVRPAVLNDRPSRGTIRVLTDLTGFHGGVIAREDVARFVLDQLRDDTWLRRSPLITW